MTDFTADHMIAAEETAAEQTGFGRHERANGARAVLVLLGILLAIGAAAVLWSPAVIFYAALVLTPLTLGAILAITRGWTM
ncbi:MAG TPA: hypothetical protein VKZ87_09645 [Ferrovibrio sp.]|jgi:hypothetical protein|uniref:hypothetical protein n=1 Tax=Ferrovibrio sp. TaxID=1917215 RepID=UPI002B4AFAD6|nr:hypothetical protein [Ferrovibrio sp.]HLT77639.1 hypothetical protein [Ferrovibrio sp.]